MTLCEQLQSLEAAARFAQAATYEIAELKGDLADEQIKDLELREGRIWANLYTYAINRRHYQVDNPSEG